MVTGPLIHQVHEKGFEDLEGGMGFGFCLVAGAVPPSDVDFVDYHPQVLKLVQVHSHIPLVGVEFAHEVAQTRCLVHQLPEFTVEGLAVPAEL